MNLENRAGISLSSDSRLVRVANEFNEIPHEKYPKTVAIVLDGNGRWATTHGLSIPEGHNAGAKAGVEAARPFINLGINTIPWIASTDNHKKRDPEEMENIFRLTNDTILNLSKEYGETIRITDLGRADALIDPRSGKELIPGRPQYLNQTLQEVREKTKNNTGPIVAVAVNYSGHDELTRIVQRFEKAKTEGVIPADTPFTRDIMFRFGDDGGLLEDVDLMIRTGGERRTSALGFRIDYSEFYITAKKLPDITPVDIMLALIAYSKRDIRHGGRRPQQEK